MTNADLLQTVSDLIVLLTDLGRFFDLPQGVIRRVAADPAGFKSAVQDQIATVSDLAEKLGRERDLLAERCAQLEAENRHLRREQMLCAINHGGPSVRVLRKEGS